MSDCRKAGHRQYRFVHFDITLVKVEMSLYEADKVQASLRFGLLIDQSVLGMHPWV
jgi:hypothetical protein